jgi:PKD repeat protein
MRSARALLIAVCPAAVCLLLTACQDNSQAPSTRSEPPLERDAPEASLLQPVDLVYVCGNKFLATNATRSPVKVTYRVIGTDETGSLTLRAGSREDEGFSETELETVEQGAVELYQDGYRVTRRRNQGMRCGAAPPAVGFAVTSSSAPMGQWTAPFTWANVAVHLSLLPTGKVLSFGLSGTAQVWDPATGSFTSIPAPAVIFCAGHSFLPDGRLLVVGGNNDPSVALNGIPDVTIFNPSSQTWTRSTPMRYARWYPSSTTLANGEAVILSGKDATGATVVQPEVWSNGALRVLSGASLSLHLYPRAFLTPTGKVFVAGESQTTHFLDPTGNGSWTTGPSRLYGGRDYGAAVMYDDGKILYVGGGRTTNTAETIDLNAATPAWQLTGFMVYARRHLNATVLPTGEVLVTGGSSGTAFNDPKSPVRVAELWNPATGRWTTMASAAITRVYHSSSILLPDGRVLTAGSGDAGPDQRNAEIFSPPYLFNGARPTISAAPSLVKYGTSFSVTSPEAASIAKVSLIRLGSTTHAFDMNQRFQRLSFTVSSGTLNIAAPSNKNRTPPGHYMLFLLNGNGVPSVGRIIKMGDDGDPGPPPPTYTIALSATGRVEGTVQVMSLKWSGAKGPTVNIFRNGTLLRTTTNDGSDSNGRTFQGAATYVFKVCETGTSVCSNEATVAFGGGTPNVAPVASFTSNCAGLTCTFTDGSTDSDGTVAAWSWTFGDGGSSTDRNPNHAYPGDGTYPVTLTVTDDKGATNQKSGSVTVAAITPPPPPPTGSAITLTATGTATATTQAMSLKWKGAQGSTVDVYRNGIFLRSTANDGSDSNGRTYAGGATYRFKVCEAGSTVCSNLATVQFGAGSQPPNVAPKADFASSCVELNCSFTDASADWDGNVGQWQWTFGDGGSSTSPSPTYAYSAGGTYTVKLVVTDNNNATGAVSKTVTVTAPPGGNQPPVANFSWSCTGLTCSFTDGSTDDGSVTGWGWDFGDHSGSSTEQNPSYTYAVGGSYTVSLTVTDNAGLTGSTEVEVVVPAP